MKPCPACQSVLANNALTCPACGHKFTSAVTWFILGAIVFIFGLIALGAVVASGR